MRWLLALTAALAAAAGGFLTGCGGAAQRRAWEELAAEDARQRRTAAFLGVCAVALAAGEVTSRVDAPREASDGADYLVLGTCLGAGAVALFGLPSFANPGPPARPIPEDELDSEPPPEPDAGSATVPTTGREAGAPR